MNDKGYCLHREREKDSFLLEKSRWLVDGGWERESVMDETRRTKIMTFVMRNSIVDQQKWMTVLAIAIVCYLNKKVILLKATSCRSLRCRIKGQRSRWRSSWSVVIKLKCLILQWRQTNDDSTEMNAINRLGNVGKKNNCEIWYWIYLQFSRTFSLS